MIAIQKFLLGMGYFLLVGSFDASMSMEFFWAWIGNGHVSEALEPSIYRIEAHGVFVLGFGEMGIW
jgi:hypothetical protein